MGTFKDWLLKELSLGSDGIRDNQPTQTAQATNKVAQNWLGSKSTVDQQTNLTNLGQTNTSALTKPLLTAGADALKLAGPTISGSVQAPDAAFQIQTALKLPTILKPPTPGKVKLMRRWMKRMEKQ